MKRILFAIASPFLAALWVIVFNAVFFGAIILGGLWLLAWIGG